MKGERLPSLCLSEIRVGSVRRTRCQNCRIAIIHRINIRLNHKHKCVQEHERVRRMSWWDLNEDLLPDVVISESEVTRSRLRGKYLKICLWNGRPVSL